MGRIHGYPLLSFRIYPPAENTAARKHERMCAVVTEDGQFYIAVERRSEYEPATP